MFRELRYSNTGINIDVDLNNGYTIRATYDFNYDERLFNVDLYIKDNKIDMYDLMERFENIKIKSRKNVIKSLIAEFIEQNYKSGNFDYYIKRYQYQQHCFDIGNDVEENNKLKEETA